MLFKLLLLQLGFTCSTAADKLRFIPLDSQCLRAFNQGFFLFCCFYFRFSGNLLTFIHEKYLFPVFFVATDGNFMEKYSVIKIKFRECDTINLKENIKAGYRNGSRIVN